MRKQRKAKLPGFFYDRWVVIATLSLLAFGIIMVASASMVISDRQYGYPFHYLIRQFIYLLIGLLAAWVATRIPIKLWQKFSGYLFIASFFLLLVVLVPGIGRVVNGSRRWINLGFITLQVSEVVKLCVILYLASYLQRYQNQIQTDIKGFLKPLLLLGVLSVLLLLQPDFGAVAVIMFTCLALMFIAGVRLWPFMVLFALVVAAMVLLAVMSPYRLQRITTFLNPWHVAYGSGYQLTQSLIAFGRGGVFGVGLGNSIQKLFYLPEAHTDFLFAVIAEELGLVGELLLVGLFTLLVVRIVAIGRKAQYGGLLFSAYVCYGVAFWLGMQAMINMGVNAGMLPTKGLTLPFISYGGSSMLVNCAVIGLVLRIAYECRFTSTEQFKTDYQYNKQQDFKQRSYR